MRLRSLVAGAAGLGIAGFGAVEAPAQGGVSLRANLSGFREVLANVGGAVFSEGTGEFRGRIAGPTIEYRLAYSFPAGTSVTQAHFHFGQTHTTGGIVVFLCANPPVTPPPDTPECPTPAGEVTGVIDASKVLAQPGQGFPAGDLDAVIAALRAGAIYVNVHTEAFPAGEIRGQVSRRGGARE
jgi:hypothetical protein